MKISNRLLHSKSTVLVSSPEHSPKVEYFLDLCKNGNFAKGPKKSKHRKD